MLSVYGIQNKNKTTYCPLKGGCTTNCFNKGSCSNFCHIDGSCTSDCATNCDNQCNSVHCQQVCIVNNCPPDNF